MNGEAKPNNTIPFGHSLPSGDPLLIGKGRQGFMVLLCCCTSAKERAIHRRLLTGGTLPEGGTDVQRMGWAKAKGGKGKGQGGRERQINREKARGDGPIWLGWASVQGEGIITHNSTVAISAPFPSHPGLSFTTLAQRHSLAKGENLEKIEFVSPPTQPLQYRRINFHHPLFCLFGQTLPDQPFPPLPIPSSQHPNFSNRKSKMPKRSNRLPLLGILLVALALVCLAAFFVWLRSEGDDGGEKGKGNESLAIAGQAHQRQKVGIGRVEEEGTTTVGGEEGQGPTGDGGGNGEFGEGTTESSTVGVEGEDQQVLEASSPSGKIFVEEITQRAHSQHAPLCALPSGEEMDKECMGQTG